MFSEQDQQSSRRSGFTLLEMMVVLVIIGLLAGVVTVNVRYFMTQGKQKTTRVQMAAFRQALDTFYTACGRYPRTEEGLDILTQKSATMPEALLRQIPLDPKQASVSAVKTETRGMGGFSHSAQNCRCPQGRFCWGLLACLGLLF